MKSSQQVKTLKYIMLVIGIGFCGQATAQEGLASLAKKVKTMRDSMVVKGVSAGVGYAYNWVPVRGLLINVLAMPMLTFVNKLKAYAYATNVEKLMENPYFWDPTTTNEEWDEWFYNNLRVTPMGDKTFNSGVSIGFDGRVSLTYNFGRYFFNAFGQFNNIRYHHNSTRGYLNDWFVNTSIGIRL